jgi:hypothetical protein
MEASYFITGTSKTMGKIQSESYAFIRGTGLEVTLERFGLDYDAEELRRVFFQLFK